ncbi:MAG: deoxyguanosinetriphosphate triphosphohydrolase [Chthoniobacteraceae bacterium]|nr:deoxyguanosinetriphosphate triphosphohydrolase [Chthoniobacteraceae bacterium]
MDWLQLLCAGRLGRDHKPAPFDSSRSDFRRDADRVTFSTAFRRLQDKTQVFPLADNDYVRTRLTHSLEVSSVGRSLGARVGAEICRRHGFTQIHPSDFGDIVSAAGLAHDIGNPPFGHSGEDAIRHWFTTSDHARVAGETFTPGQRADIEWYEGNAQGFRLLTRLQMPENAGGLQLTHAMLGAFTKYPRESSAAGLGSAAGETYRGASAKKFGFNQSERAHFESVALHCGLIRRSADAAWWARHPLAFLVEAADDICYRLVDFEDGFRLGYIRYAEVRESFFALMADKSRPTRLHEAQSDLRRVQIMRAMAIGSAIDHCADLFLENEEAILAGTFDSSLIDASPFCKAWKQIQNRSQEAIYGTTRSVEIEAAGFEVLAGLLDVFVSAINDLAARGESASLRSKKLLMLLPPEVFDGGPGRIPTKDGYDRLLRILDFVSGMTDSYAVSLYKKVRGISLPGR